METDHDAEDVVYVPLAALTDAETYTSSGNLSVDGETFTLRTRDSDGSHHYDWISGPNDGYGFSMSGSFEPISHERHVAAIRGFLSAIDPATGYLYDS